MEFKSEPYIGNPNDMFDIPAAEQEITVGSNEPTILSTSLVSQSPIITSSGLMHHHHHGGVGGGGQIILNDHHNAGGFGPMGMHPSGVRQPRVIMLQRSGMGGGIGGGMHLAGAPVQRPAFKTVKIITVPGQGVGGKPLKAAVIPMHMLQRGMRVVSSVGNTNLISVSQAGGISAMPRVLTIRAPGQMTSGAGTVFSGHGGGIPGMTAMRPGTLILSSNAAHAAPMVSTMGGGGVHYGNSEDVENSMHLHNVASVGGGGMETLQHTHPGLMNVHQGGHTYYDMQTGLPTHGAVPGYMQPGSPTGRESGDEQEQVPTGLKTNGLRRYARCVCNKVKEKGTTSYSEVADELVHEYAAEHPMIPSEQLHYIQKNIRRRVYDALNVLMALNVLQKEKKEIRWVGLPVNMIEECRRLEEEREKCQISLRNKTLEVQDLILQLIAFKNLVMRNRINDRYHQNQSVVAAAAAAAEAAAQASDSSTGGVSANDAHLQGLLLGPGALKARTEKIPLPFLVISTHRKTVIDCNISSDKLEYLFNLDQAFEVRDEVDTLKRMGLMLRLGTIHCTQEEYNQCLELVPPSLRFYVEAIYERRQAIVPDFDALHQQRRLFVEARLAAAAANQAAVAAGQPTDEHGDPLVVGGAVGGVGAGANGPGLRASHSSGSIDHTGSHHHYGNLFDAGVGDSSLRQLYLATGRGVNDDDVDEEDDVVDHLGPSSSGNSGLQTSGFVPGDTQHYARAAASRGYVVPGGPGGLLRHRQHPSTSGGGNVIVTSATTGRQAYAGELRHSLGRGGLLSTSGAGIVGGSLIHHADSPREDMSAAAALVAGSSSARGVGHVIVGDDVELVNPEDLMGDPADDEDDDEDDDDMEEV